MMRVFNYIYEINGYKNGFIFIYDIYDLWIFN